MRQVAAMSENTENQKPGTSGEWWVHLSDPSPLPLDRTPRLGRAALDEQDPADSEGSEDSLAQTPSEGLSEGGEGASAQKPSSPSALDTRTGTPLFSFELASDRGPSTPDSRHIGDSAPTNAAPVHAGCGGPAPAKSDTAEQAGLASERRGAGATRRVGQHALNKAETRRPEEVTLRPSQAASEQRGDHEHSGVGGASGLASGCDSALAERSRVPVQPPELTALQEGEVAPAEGGSAAETAGEGSRVHADPSEQAAPSRRGPGRPRSSNPKRKSHKVYLSEAESDYLEAQARASGRKVSAYLRGLALEQVGVNQKAIDTAMTLIGQAESAAQQASRVVRSGFEYDPAPTGGSAEDALGADLPPEGWVIARRHFQKDIDFVAARADETISLCRRAAQHLLSASQGREGSAWHPSTPVAPKGAGDHPD